MEKGFALLLPRLSKDFNIRAASKTLVTELMIQVFIYFISQEQFERLYEFVEYYLSEFSTYSNY